MNDFPMYGALDIGSNAARLLFANIINVNNEPKVFKNTLIRLPIRLGEDVYQTGFLSEQKITLISQTIEIFKSLTTVYKPIDTAIYATAALREATNSKLVLEFLQNKHKVHINIINGLEEARIIKDLYQHYGKPTHWKLLADLGGGSLELTIVSPEQNQIASKSFKIGAVRALTSTIPEKEFQSLYNWLIKHLPKNSKKINFIATGGNINTLKKTFSSPTKDFLTTSELVHIKSTLEPLAYQERISQYFLRPDRADVIIPACKIFIEIMNTIGIEKVYVPGGGLADGIVLQLYQKIHCKGN
jgi:exopolyphosphatase/guanosine-5'-triphosphate,3'-diphosphate pyrophosphatase